ncbi:MAG TPA: hypothetical protein DEF41_12110 [Desulfovibrio sp.]|uniref:Uncharacterized protein n=1 Tax=Nitratidesulfovibrio vulgaris (strain ATCC 29579 / DSM 644 / CCUG 34227 / NCIMB 8303 / VKM B-1760 / Hildenborough) TaxID=882 RepID=Q72BK0_NITV2|nr:hypothetical protein DVU_1635 [Nitratidesulfovibrio vulgaris str. Hildenborough]HBW16836.1 hypothetical protein [Desulfovibrio sp.]
MSSSDFKEKILLQLLLRAWHAMVIVLFGTNFLSA